MTPRYAAPSSVHVSFAAPAEPEAARASPAAEVRASDEADLGELDGPQLLASLRQCSADDVDTVRAAAPRIAGLECAADGCDGRWSD